MPSALSATMVQGVTVVPGFAGVLNTKLFVNQRTTHAKYIYGVDDVLFCRTGLSSTSLGRELRAGAASKRIATRNDQFQTLWLWRRGHNT